MPRQTRDTERPVLPRFAYFMVLLRNRADHHTRPSKKPKGTQTKSGSPGGSASVRGPQRAVQEPLLGEGSYQRPPRSPPPPPGRRGRSPPPPPRNRSPPGRGLASFTLI